MKFFKSMKAKLLALGSALFVGANSAFAGITMDASGVVTGTFDMAPVFAVASAIFIALGGLVVVRWAINFIRKG